MDRARIDWRPCDEPEDAIRMRWAQLMSGYNEMDNYKAVYYEPTLSRFFKVQDGPNGPLWYTAVLSLP